MRTLIALLLSACACFGQAFSPFDFPPAPSVQSDSTNTLGTPMFIFSLTNSLFTKFNLELDGDNVNAWHTTTSNYVVRFDTSASDHPVFTNNSVSYPGYYLTNFTAFPQPMTLYYVISFSETHPFSGGWQTYIGGTFDSFHIVAQATDSENSPIGVRLEWDSLQLVAGETISDDDFHVIFVGLDGTNSFIQIDDGDRVTGESFPEDDVPALMFGNTFLTTPSVNFYKEVGCYPTLMDSNAVHSLYNIKRITWGLP